MTVGLHSSDDGLTRYFNLWEGRPDGEHLPFAKPSAFLDIMHTQGRGIFDAVASFIGHELLSRFPTLRILPVENGSGLGAAPRRRRSAPLTHTAPSCTRRIH